MQNTGMTHRALSSLSFRRPLVSFPICFQFLCSATRNVPEGPPRQQPPGYPPPRGITHACVYCLLLLAEVFFYFPELNCGLMAGDKWKALSTLVPASTTSTHRCGNHVSVIHFMKPSKSLKTKSSPRQQSRFFFPAISPDWAPGLSLFFFFSRVLLITVLPYSSENTFLDWHTVDCDLTGCNPTPSADRISGATFLPPTGLSVNMEIKASARTNYTNLHFHITETSF